MKLLRCHIENFGKFSSSDYTFNGGLNSFCEENGYGKTTIAAFIKAMFYGMSSYTAKTAKFPERMHYFPFGGGKYGGSLTFETDGDEYRIERFFDEKSDVRDALKVYRNGAPYDGFGKDVGMTVFGIDRESFERTVFIDSGAVELGASDGISAKLGGIAGGTDGDETVTAAVSALTDAAKRYKLEKGKRGKIYDLSQKTDDLAREIRQAEAAASALGGMYAEYNALQAEISGLEEKKNIAGKAEVNRAQWQTYDDAVAQENAALQEYNAVVKAYPRGIPSADEIKLLKDYNADIERNKSVMGVQTFGGDRKARLEDLKKRFASGVPDDGLLSEADGQAMQCAVLEREIDGLSGAPADERLKAYSREFESGVPDGGAMAACEQKLKALRETDARISARTSALPQTPPPQGKKGGKRHILAGIIALLLIIGGAALTFINTVAGGVLAGAGALLFIAATALYLKSRKPAEAAPVQVDDILADLHFKKSEYTEELRVFLSRYGYVDADVAGNFFALKNDILNFTELKNAERSKAENVKNKTAELGALKTELTRLLAAYGITNGDLQAGVRQLRGYRDEYLRLCGEQSRAADSLRQAGDGINASLQAVNVLLAKYGMALNGSLTELTERIERDLTDADRLKREADRRRAQAENYKRQYGLADRPAPAQGGEDMDDLSGRLADRNRRLAALGQKIKDLEDGAERLDGLKDSLADAEEQLAAAEERHKLLTAARQLLERANRNLKDRYVAPVKDRFTYYAGKIKEALGDDVAMDGNYNVSFERGGAITSDKYLSAGQRCVCALCFRLALIDNMYPAEQPFIVMDDPFVNLDEARLKDALKLVKALAKDRQIIYFSCHNSRRAG